MPTDDGWWQILIQVVSCFQTGLAVGDVEAVQEQARVKKLAMQVGRQKTYFETSLEREVTRCMQPGIGIDTCAKK